MKNFNEDDIKNIEKEINEKLKKRAQEKNSLNKNDINNNKKIITNNFKNISNNETSSVTHEKNNLKIILIFISLLIIGTIIFIFLNNKKSITTNTSEPENTIKTNVSQQTKLSDNISEINNSNNNDKIIINNNNVTQITTSNKSATSLEKKNIIFNNATNKKFVNAFKNSTSQENITENSKININFSTKKINDKKKSTSISANLSSEYNLKTTDVNFSIDNMILKSDSFPGDLSFSFNGTISNDILYLKINKIPLIISLFIPESDKLLEGWYKIDNIEGEQITIDTSLPKILSTFLNSHNQQPLINFKNINENTLLFSLNKNNILSYIKENNILNKDDLELSKQDIDDIQKILNIFLDSLNLNNSSITIENNLITKININLSGKINSDDLKNIKILNNEITESQITTYEIKIIKNLSYQNTPSFKAPENFTLISNFLDTIK